MSGPRNRKAYAGGLAVRAAVTAILAAHHPLAAPLSAKAINARLPPHLRRSENRISAHRRAIQCELALQECAARDGAEIDGRATTVLAETSSG
jgi:hypothetical protein